MLSQTLLRVLLNTCINRNSKARGDFGFVDKKLGIVLLALLMTKADDKSPLVRDTWRGNCANDAILSARKLANGIWCPTWQQAAGSFVSVWVADDSYKKIFHRVNNYKPLGGNGYGLPYYSKNLFCKNKKQKYLYPEPKTKPTN